LILAEQQSTPTKHQGIPTKHQVIPAKHQEITIKHQDILTKHQAIASGLKMQAKLAATFDAIFAWTDPLRLRKLAQIHFSLLSGITILK
jgi:hypothetical protein